MAAAAAAAAAAVRLMKVWLVTSFNTGKIEKTVKCIYTVSRKVVLQKL